MPNTILQNKDGSFTYNHEDNFTCDNGSILKGFKLTFETHGKKDKPLIIVNHALSSSYHIAATELNPQKGWWQNNIGVDKCLNTDKYYILSIGNLGSRLNCSNAENTKNFPDITINDIAKAQLLLLEALKINNVNTVIGNSMGGYVSLVLAMYLGDRLKNLINISSGLKVYPVNKAIHSIQKEIIMRDPNWESNRESANILIARKLGLLSYFNPSYINDRFKYDSELESYLDYNAKKFLSITTPRIYVSNLNTMDEFNLNNYFSSYEQACQQIKAKCLIIGVTSDTLIPVAQQEELHKFLISLNVKSKLQLSNSDKGHDAFYTDEAIAQYVSAQLA